MRRYGVAIGKLAGVQAVAVGAGSGDLQEAARDVEFGPVLNPVVADFEGGVDRIDLRGQRDENGGQRLTYEQLTLTELADRLRIELDIDRDGVADPIDLDEDGAVDPARIDVLGATLQSVSPNDFIF